MSLPLQPNQYPNYYVVKDPTGSSRCSESSKNDYWQGHYGRNGVYTSQATIDDHNRRVFAANNGIYRK